MTYPFPTPQEGPPPRRPARGPLVPLAHTTDPVRAHILCSVLEADGIDAYVLGEHAAATLAPVISMTVSVHVARDDYARGVESLTRRLPRGAAAPAGDHGPETGPVTAHAGNAIASEQDLAGPDAPRPSRCPYCRYDLSGLEDPSVCPECGEEVPMIAGMVGAVTLAPPPGGTRLAERVGVGIALLAVAFVAVVLVAVTLAGR